MSKKYLMIQVLYFERALSFATSFNAFKLKDNFTRKKNSSKV